MCVAPFVSVAGGVGSTPVGPQRGPAPTARANAGCGETVSLVSQTGLTSDMEATVTGTNEDCLVVMECTECSPGRSTPGRLTLDIPFQYQHISVRLGSVSDLTNSYPTVSIEPVEASAGDGHLSPFLGEATVLGQLQMMLLRDLNGEVEASGFEVSIAELSVPRAATPEVTSDTRNSLTVRLQLRDAATTYSRLLIQSTTQRLSAIVAALSSLWAVWTAMFRNCERVAMKLCRRRSGRPSSLSAPKSPKQVQSARVTPTAIDMTTVELPTEESGAAVG